METVTGTGKTSFPSGFALVRDLIQMAMSAIVLPPLSALVCLMLLFRVEGMKQNAGSSVGSVLMTVFRYSDPVVEDNEE